MFTGIIKNTGVIKELKKKNSGYFLSIISNLNFNKRDIGTSISCSGVCLTLTKIKKNTDLIQSITGKNKRKF